MYKKTVLFVLIEIIRHLETNEHQMNNSFCIHMICLARV